MGTIKGSINLSAFKHILTKVKNQAGESIDALIIPLKSNGLMVNEKSSNVFFNIVGWDNKTQNDYSTHMIKQSFSKEDTEKMSDDEKKNQPIFGNLDTRGFAKKKR